MTIATAQSAPSALPERLRQRLEEMGLALAWISPESVEPATGCAWVERLLLHSPVVRGTIRRLWTELTQAHGHPVELFPGLNVIVLPAHRRRRLPRGEAPTRLLVAILLDHRLLHSEQWFAACNHAALDVAAATVRIEVSRLVSIAEARRLASMLEWMFHDSLEIDRRHSELQSLSSQLGDTYEELSLLYRLSANMLVNQAPADFLTGACAELQQVLGVRWMALQLTDDEPRLNHLAGEVFTAGPINLPKAELQRIGKNLLRLQPAGNQPLIADQTATLAVPGLDALAHDLLVVSMMRGDKPYGILFGGDKINGSHISSIDSKLCSSLANSLAIFIENMMLFEDMEAMFLGTLHALTSSIDAKDSYTHGHSERVALLSRQLAQAAGLDAHAIDRVYISALVHDVGKIGVPESVLCKTGHLTDEEFALIKLHPQIGARILQDIRQMQDLIPGVLYHHERWDGRGYPFGLTGPSIPLFGRVICLADSFDAMSSNRTYRQALSLPQALGEIRRCAGAQFDPDLAARFLQLDFGPFFDLIRRHQQAAAARPGGQQP